MLGSPSLCKRCLISPAEIFVGETWDSLLLVLTVSGVTLSFEYIAGSDEDLNPR